MKLPEPAQLERIRGSDQWRVVNDFTVVLDDGRSITVPHGFITDKASVPRAVWWLIPRDDKYIVDGALIHDNLYLHQKIEGHWISRLEADKILRDIAKHVGMGWLKRKAVYRAVRLGGWVSFNPVAKKLDNPYG